MKIQIAGKEIEGDYVGFDAKEVWTEITLANGYQVRIKLVVASVFVSQDKQATTGLPLVNVMSNNVMSVLPPPDNLVQ